MKKLALFIVMCVLSVSISGCGASLGIYPTLSETQVQLSRKNYRVIKSGVTATASVYYVLNVFPLDDTQLYKRAMNELRKKANMEGKSCAIANVTQDFSASTFLVVGKASVTLTADIVEFTE